MVQHYTDYDTYYRLTKQAADDRDFPKRRTAVALAKYMTLHPYNIEQKTEVIVEHFREHVRRRIGGRAKAMVVTSSRLHAVRYMLAFERYIAGHGYEDIRPLVAFSGTVADTGEEFTEPGMNADVVTGKRIGEAALPTRFDSPDYRILLVAHKYQTGFDQPLLQAMYVDKRLDGVQAVQTLSRLNRVCRGKEAPSSSTSSTTPTTSATRSPPTTTALSYWPPPTPTSLSNSSTSSTACRSTMPARSRRSRRSSTRPKRDSGQQTTHALRRALRDEDVRKIAVANPFDKFSLGIRERLGQLMIERMGENDALVTRYLSDPEFQEIAFAALAREIFQEVAEKRQSLMTD